jgi:transposase
VPRDGPGIAKAGLIGRIRRQVSQAGRSYDGFWLHRLLEARRVCNPRSASLVVDGRVRRAKTDWVDVERKTSADARRPSGGPLVSALAQTPRLD